MLDKIKSLFGGGKYERYLKQCEQNGSKPLSKDEWLAQQPPKQSC